MTQPNLDQPAFCQDCFCESCWSGFYPHGREALKIASGQLMCVRKGCVGRVEPIPPLQWGRLSSCRQSCGNGLRA